MTQEPTEDHSEELFTSDDAVQLYTERIQNPTLFPEERKAVERYFPDTDGHVLDVGCGVGRVSHLLNERGYDVTGIDVSEPLVEKARSLFPDIGFYVGDVRDTQFDSDSFEYVVFSYFGLDYLHPKKERISALNEIQRVLKPGGVLVFSSHNCWHPVVPLSLRNLGFAVKDIFDLYLRPKNLRRLGSRYKYETVPLGEIKIYLSDPLHQRRQLKKYGFTPLDVIGEWDDARRYFERDPHYVARN